MNDEQFDSGAHETTQVPAACSGASLPGFGKDVNDYLNHYVTVIDAKAGGFLVASLLLLDFMSDRTYSPIYSIPFHTMSVVGLLVGAILCTICLFPRLPRGKKGLIFWEDIQECGGPDAYASVTNGLDEARREKEYAWQNYFVSIVLHKKSRLMQWAIIATLLSSLSLLIAELGT